MESSKEKECNCGVDEAGRPYDAITVMIVTVGDKQAVFAIHEKAFIPQIDIADGSVTVAWNHKGKNILCKAPLQPRFSKTLAEYEAQEKKNETEKV